jgi:hypothetical protein
MKKLAREMKAAFEELSPLIEQYTAEVCPTCVKVCCIDRHGTHEPLDLLFIEALDEGPPPEPPLDDDTKPCRHLGPMGCTVERWRRPFRCTWYFCPALLEYMPRLNPREYRRFMHALARLQGLREQISGLVAAKH